MTARRTAWLLPLLVSAALAFTYPWFSQGFDLAVSTVRIRVGRLGTQLGLVAQSRGVLLGIYRAEAPYSMARLEEMERALGKSFDIVSFYQTWGDREEDEFPRALMRHTAQHGIMAMITWEPWLSQFERNRGRAQYGTRTDLREIAAGAYDGYIRAWAREAAAHGRPFLLRFAHEMNNPHYPWSLQAGNDAGDYITAWRHVWTLFEEEGADNVVWVWSPQGVPPQELYPGAAYVDWIGVSVLNYGAFAPDRGWHSFEYLYEPIYRSALRYERPIMIAELATVALGGSQADWYAAALERITTKYPHTRALVLFNNPVDQTLPGAVVDWSIDGRPGVLDVLRDHLAEGSFARR